jgi:hypothetical protein
VGSLVGAAGPAARFVVAVILGYAYATPSATAAIDPLAPGPHAVRTIEYTAGSLRIALPGTRFAGPVAFEPPPEGSIT